MSNTFTKGNGKLGFIRKNEVQNFMSYVREQEQLIFERRQSKKSHIYNCTIMTLKF